MLGIKTAEKIQEGSIFGQITSLGHEQVVICYDEPTGLKAIIAIHNTVLGPALGGSRLWNYSSEEAALRDVLRLSRGMTFKAAISGLNLGGGKAVLIGDPQLKTEAYLRRFGRFVESLGGRYITAEDVNMNAQDMAYIAMETKHVTGLPDVKGGNGDPSPITAFGTFQGMKAAANKAFGTDSLAGKKVAVQGIGQVGKSLVEYLVKEGANVFITDVYEDKLRKVADKTGATVVDPMAIYDIDMDIFAPCALGASLNDDTLGRLKCAVIAGAANNQLEDDERHGRMLLEKGIIYAPDFLINAGGVMHVYAEYVGGYQKEWSKHQAERIYDTCLMVLNKSASEHLPTQQVAMQLATDRISALGKVKLSY
jgi:leucine dehydrogenase